MACEKIITDADAQQIFGSLQAPPTTDGCTLEEFDTKMSTIDVVWSKDGNNLVAIVLSPTSCAPSTAVVHGDWAIEIPAAVARSCNDAAARTEKAISHGAPSPKGAGPSASTLARVGAFVRQPVVAASLVAVVALILVLATIRFQRRRKRAKAATAAHDEPSPPS